MRYAKILNQIFTGTNLLSIKASSSFGQTFQKITKAKTADFIWVKKTDPAQMGAVLVSRLVGKKFLWVQGFTNPPKPNFLARLLLSQADKIIVKSKNVAEKLSALGIDKTKIRYNPQESPNNY